MFGRKKRLQAVYHDVQRNKLEEGLAQTMAFYYALGRLDSISDDANAIYEIATDFVNYARDLEYMIPLYSGWLAYTTLLRSLIPVTELPHGYLSDDEWEDYAKFLDIDNGEK